MIITALIVINYNNNNHNNNNKSKAFNDRSKRISDSGSISSN